MIKKYTKFLESRLSGIKIPPTSFSNDYSIYEWYSFIHNANTMSINESSLKLWSDHFIGAGYYDKINNKIKKIFRDLDKVEIDDIDAIYIDIIDLLPYNSHHTNYAIFSGNYKEDELKLNSVDNIKDTSDKTRLQVICGILGDIVRPTLFISVGRGSGQSELIRTTKEAEFVTSEDYQCCNFRKNLSLYEIDLHKTTTFKNYDLNYFSLKTFEKYDIDKIIDYVKGGIFFSYRNSRTTMIDILKIYDESKYKEETILSFLNKKGIDCYIEYDREDYIKFNNPERMQSDSYDIKIVFN